MKKVLHVPLLLAGLLSLTPFVLAQQNPPAQQGGQNKLVEIVRNAIIGSVRYQVPHRFSIDNAAMDRDNSGGACQWV